MIPVHSLKKLEFTIIVQADVQNTPLMRIQMQHFVNPWKTLTAEMIILQEMSPEAYLVFSMAMEEKM